MRKLRMIVCLATFSAMTMASISAATAADETVNGAQQATPNAEADAAKDSASSAVPQSAPPESPTSDASAQAATADPYSVKSFFADFTHFAVGDTVPELYRSKKYEVTQWMVRYLPAPVADSHWTYMGGNYVMITNAGGKILKAESGEIYYKH